jgi:GT2 family glycosyltransferase
MGTQLPVILCTWRRIERLPRTLEQLAAQDVPVQVCIWNNSPERGRVDAAAAAAGLPVSVHHSPRNIGGFGRFYLARQAAEAGHPAVAFIDDDQDFGPQAIGELLSAHRPRSLSGWWAFRFTGSSYGDRIRAAAGQAASYVGTGGMITDTAIFLDGRLFQCPRRFWFVEDLWLCYVADLAGYELFRSPAEFVSAEDEHALYLSLGDTKWRLLRYLTGMGWEPIQRDSACPKPASSSVSISKP